MSTKNDVLRLLISSSNEYISGQKLAKMLKVSRAAVWKAIKSLEKDGFNIKAKTNKGYCLDDKTIF